MQGVAELREALRALDLTRARVWGRSSALLEWRASMRRVWGWP